MGFFGAILQLTQCGDQLGVHEPRFSPDGRFVTALASPAPEVTPRLMVWNAQTGVQVRVSKESGDCAYSADSRYMAFGAEPTVTITGPDAGHIFAAAPVTSPVLGLQFDPVEPWLAINTIRGLVVRAVDGSSISPEQLEKHWFPVIRDDKRGINLISGTGTTLATWASSPSGGHVVYTPEGTYAGQGDGPDLAGWVLDGASRVRRLREATSDPSIVGRRLGIASGQER